MGNLASNRALALALACLASACSTPPPAPTPAPTLDAGQVASAAERRSSIDAPFRITFEWSATEPGARMSGRGLARVEPPYRARLDLFADNGEHVAAAVLDGDDLRVAAGAQTSIPPAPLLWGALGVFRPGFGTALAGGRVYPGGELLLRYLMPGGELEYRLRDDLVEGINLMVEGSTVEELSLARGAGERFPRRATYRHLVDVLELEMTLESVEDVESYPTDIWTSAF
jgi:hypothetical protein